MSDLKQELREMMEERGLSLSAVSRALGISTTALSQWSNGVYKGSIAKVERSVKSFLEKETERLKTPKKTFKFTMTSVTAKVFEAARMCHLDNEIGVTIGNAGVGKTEAVKEYARRNPDVLLIEADLGLTAKSLFAELNRMLGNAGVGSVHKMFEDAVDRLKGSGRLIIVDEAEHLPYRALELLRRVYDKAGVGLLLVGLPRLLSNLRGKRGEYAQLYSRVGVAYRLENLKHDDTKTIVQAAIKGSNGLWKAFHETSGGNTRTLCKLINRSLRIAGINDAPLTPDYIREAAKTLII